MASVSDTRVGDMKERFHAKLAEMNKSDSSDFLKEEKYYELVNDVEGAKKAAKKSCKDYRRIKRFDVLTINETKKLIVPTTKTKGEIIYYVHENEIFDILHSVHLNTGHGGRNRMENSLKSKYKNISRDIIMIYLNLCEPCQKKFSHPRKGLVVKPMIFNAINARGQVDLIDMQTCRDGEFKFIMVYQDHLSKFVCLRPLKTKTAAEVAYNLIDVFCFFGAPSVLQSDNGREFSNHVINELKNMWEGLTIVHGKPRHSESQGSVERANQDVENMIFTWMEENNSKQWSEGLRFCQFRKNSSLHSGIQQTPFEAMFGRKAHIGLNSSVLPNNVLNSLVSEEDLQHALNTVYEENNLSDDSAEQNDEAINSSQVITTNEIPVQNEQKSCCICELHHEDSHVCNICSQSVHDTCAVSEDSKLYCMRCHTKKRQGKSKTKALESLKKQAKKMKLSSEKAFPKLAIGTTVKIPIPSVDRSKVDAKNILGLVLEVTDDGYYKLGTLNGTINCLFSRNQISDCKESFLRAEDIPNKEISLREASRKESRTGGQGYVHCSCKQKCSNKKCKCNANGIKCNSKCHSSLPCTNK